MNNIFIKFLVLSLISTNAFALMDLNSCPKAVKVAIKESLKELKTCHEKDIIHYKPYLQGTYHLRCKDKRSKVKEIPDIFRS